jgi:hypothetical protein
MAAKKKAAAKKVAPKLGPKTLMPVRPGDKPGVRQNMPNKSTDKPGVKVNMAKKAKKVKVEGPSYFTPNDMYKLPMTPAQMRAFGKLNMSPKTSQTMFTVPKGTTGMSQKEIDRIQAQRSLDRKRTLSRASNIIRRPK